MVGTNDFSPFTLPGVGTVTTEYAVAASDMPLYFKAYESAALAPDSLRSQGVLRGFGLTTPERFVIATWKGPRGGGEGKGIVDTAWNYAITSGARVGDSAVAYWWGPFDLDSGEERSVQTAYGLGGTSGATAILTAPPQVTCEALQFEASVQVTNASTEVLLDGNVALSLPEGIYLANGQSPNQAISRLSPGQSVTLSWGLVASGAQATTASLASIVTFPGLLEPIEATAPIQIPLCEAPEPTPTPTSTPDEVPEPGSILLMGLGLAGLARFLRKRF
jgi:hypothetical protein